MGKADLQFPIFCHMGMCSAYLSDDYEVISSRKSRSSSRFALRSEFDTAEWSWVPTEGIVGESKDGDEVEFSSGVCDGGLTCAIGRGRGKRRRFVIRGVM